MLAAGLVRPASAQDDAPRRLDVGRFTAVYFPDDDRLARWIGEASEKIAFQGLPARICWLGYGERPRLGLRFNEMVRSGEISGPIVIGRDHLDSG